MMPIKELLDKIKWDSHENPDAFEIFYYDRVRDVNLMVKYSDIKRTEGEFIIIERDGEESSIPMHRIREVHKEGKTVWRRRG